MSVVLDVRQNSESTDSPYRRTRCVPPGVGAARGVLEADADAEAEAEAAAAVEEERIRVADPPPTPALGGRPRADRAGVRAMAADDDDDAPVRSSVMLWDDATSADAAAALLVVVLPIPALADLPALNDDDDDGMALPVFSLSGVG